MERLNWNIRGLPIPRRTGPGPLLGDAAVNHSGAKGPRIRVKRRLTARFDRSGPGKGAPLFPAFEAGRLVAAHQRMGAVECGVGVRVVGALVGAAALLP